MVRILRGLQLIYTDPDIRGKVFKVLEVLSEKNSKTGRPGMDLWKILVLGSVRLCKKYDFDELIDAADNHNKIREMLGHPAEDRSTYDYETVRRNIQLFTDETLAEINQIVVNAEHKVVLKKGEGCAY